jgi:hypothetical protein
MKAYAESLESHGLIYHPFKDVADCTRREFWGIKSHQPFHWGEGDDNSNRYIGFLGYEIQRNGHMRLRKSNIKRVDEKLDCLRYALRRFRKKHTEEEYNDYRKKKLNNVLKGFDTYKSLDQKFFENGKQYNHVKKLVDAMKCKD